MTLVLICFLGIVGLVLDHAFRNSVAQGEQQRLETTLYGLLAVADITPSQKISIPNFLTDERLNRPGSGLFAVITDINNQTIWRSRSLLGIDLAVPGSISEGERSFQLTSNTLPYVIYSAGIGWEMDDNAAMHLNFHILSSPDGYLAQVTQFRQSLWGWLLAVTLILLFIQFILLRWSLAPLRRVADDLLDVENGSKNRLSSHYPLELAGLTHNLNHLLKTREQQLTRYRNSLADLAHSLKTPLAVLRTIEPGDDINQQRIIKEQTERLTRIVEYQLQRAATAGHAGLANQTFIEPTIQRLADSLNKVYADKKIAFEARIAEKLQLAIEENDLMELMGNLLDNAFKWANKTVRVSARAQAETILIEIEDDGPGIDADAISHVMQRGARADLAVDGQGIGLAVCHDIVSAYQGTIDIAQSDMHGAKISITLNT